jgi:hypothetical protein
LPSGIQQPIKLQTPPTGFLGMDTASEPTSLDLSRSRRLYNAYQGKLRALTQRPGSAPVTSSALGSDIKHLTRFPFEQTVSVGAAPTGAPVGDAASTLPDGTYYVRYTFETDTGETEASGEVSVVVPPAVADPDTAPTLGQSADGTETLPDGDYFVAYTWKNAVGETMVSPEATITIAAGNKLDITIPALASGATSASIYVGTVTGILYYQDNISITTHSINAPIATVTAPPVANTCIVAKLRVTVPAVPFHANKTNVYISSTTNTEKLEGSTTTTTFDQSTALDGTVAYPTANTTELRNDILAASGTALYSFYNDELHSATMTDALVTSEIYDIDFTDSLLTEVKLIADTGDLKQYDGTTVVDVTPASDEPNPAPANVLGDINAKGIKFIWQHNGYVFVSPGTNEVFYSKRYDYTYFPETFYELLVRDGDYVNGCGVSFDNVCLIPMRRGWDVWQGDTSDDFDGSEYLNTRNGVIAPRSIDVMRYTNEALETIVYLSDDGVNEIRITSLVGTTRQYATRNLMTNKIDWDAYGFTQTEKEAAIGKFISKWNMYLLEITRDTTNYVFGYDTRNQEWYMWTGLTIHSLLENEGTVYYAGNGFLKSFDSDLNDDWTDFAKTTGTPIDFDRISGMIWFEDTGYDSTLDYYILRLKEFSVVASLDVSIIYLQGIEEATNAIQNSYLVWDVSAWDVASWANLEYTDLVSSPKRLSHRLSLPKKGYFFQVRLRNNRSEPVEIYGETFIGRVSGEI